MISIRTEKELEEALRDARPGETLRLGEGDFRMKGAIFAPGLTLIGEGAEKTRILWGDYAKKKDAQGRDYNTFRTFTIAVCADGVTMRDLAIENDAGSPERLGQEVALTVYGDGFLMERCRLASTQDTLFLGPLPDDLIDRYEGFLPDCLRERKPCAQRFSECLIEGTVDFIFGCGQATFERCEIRSLKDRRGVGYVAAPAHALSQEEGFLFDRCALTAEEGVADGSIYLARPWRDYGMCAFRNCSYGPHISPLGFDKWNSTERDKTARFYETPLPRGRVPWAREG